ncbi:MAG: DUF362 domain-containing protein [Myxococcota bacterium]
MAEDDTTHRTQHRRQFIRQVGVVSGLSLGAGYLSLAPKDWPLSLSDPDGEGGKPRPRRLALPEGGYAVAEGPFADLGIAHGEDVAKMVRASIEAIGGVRRFIAPGEVVVIKPNVAFERSAALGATTNPEVLAALIRFLLVEGRAGEVRVCDNPIESPESCFAKSGIRKAALEAGARVYLPRSHDFELLNTPGAKWIENWPFFWRPFLGADKVIGLAPVKDHNLCAASMTTKNWYGLLGGRRNQFHQDIHGIITDLAQMMRPTFVMLDGTRVLFRSGPTGGSLDDVRPGQTLAAATDSLAADAYGWDVLLKRKPDQRPAYLSQASLKSLGNPDWKGLNVKEVQIG